MKKLLILLSLFCLMGCANHSNTQKVEGEASYNVNLYDAEGDWYETGLLIESFDNRNFIQIDDGRYELLLSDKEEYRYMIETEDEMFYVK